MTIIDLKGVSIFKLFMGKMKKFTKIGTEITQNNFPEIMGNLYIINSGMFFSGIWKIISGWIDPVTRKKIIIISGSGKKQLKEIIDEETLPTFLGGKFEGDIRKNPGPWKEALEKSFKNQTLKHHDQSLVDKFFLGSDGN